MDQKIRKCKGFVFSAEINDDTSCGYNMISTPCGEGGRHCQQCIDMEKFGLKHHFCGIKVGGSTCKETDKKGYQCGKCRKEDEKELTAKKNQSH